MKRTIRVEPFDASFLLVVGEGARDALFRQMKVAQEDNTAIGAVYRFGTDAGVPFFVMHLPPERDEEVTYHEALHMAVLMMSHFGVEISAHNDETLAHLQGHIVRQIDRAVYKRRPRVNRTKQKSEVE